METLGATRPEALLVSAQSGGKGPYSSIPSRFDAVVAVGADADVDAITSALKSSFATLLAQFSDEVPGDSLQVAPQAAPANAAGALVSDAAQSIYTTAPTTTSSITTTRCPMA